MESAEVWRERAVEAGRELVERAESLKSRGLIEGYEICVSHGDPAIVDHVTIIKRGQRTLTLGHGVLPGLGK